MLIQQIDEPPSLIVDVIINDQKWHKTLNNIENWADETARIVIASEELSNEPMEIAIVLTNPTEIQQLNHDFRNQDKPTNVLSFPAQVEDAEAFPMIDSFEDIPRPLGDVVISLDTLINEAKEQDKPLYNHATHILIHGILHLLGYDHIKDDDAKIMEAKEIMILSKIGIDNPYE